ncbi:MAG: hypothetical protein GXX84_12510 [Acidobacteria bacterium]|nr:hypothetical protein [Acidobacteriota bacterium]
MRGHFVTVAAPAPGTEIPVDFQSILPGKLVGGVSMGDATPQVLIPELAELVKSRQLPLHRLIKRYRIKDLNQAMHDMQSGVTLKPVIVY